MHTLRVIVTIIALSVALPLTTYGASPSLSFLRALPLKGPVPPGFDRNNPEGHKSLVVKFHITAAALTVQNITVKYGRTRPYLADPDLFRIALLDFSGQLRDGIGTYDPRGIRVYQPVGPGKFNETYILRPEADGVFVIPFVPKLHSLRFSDHSGHSYGIVQVANEIRAFCADKTFDRDCVHWLADFGKSPVGPGKPPVRTAPRNQMLPHGEESPTGFPKLRGSSE